MMADFEDRFKELHAELRGSLRSDKHATIVSILSIHDDSGGQWIIGDPAQDPAKVAARLRVCADVLDKQAAYNSSTEGKRFRSVAELMAELNSDDRPTEENDHDAWHI